MSPSRTEPLSDTPVIRRSSSSANGQPASSRIDESQWLELRGKVMGRMRRQSAIKIFGSSASGGAVYRWGMAASLGEACDPLTVALSRLAGEGGEKSIKLSNADLVSAAELFVDTIHGTEATVAESASIVLWAAAMPALCQRLDERTWWSLLEALQRVREAAVQRDRATSPQHLMLAGELGLTLAWRLADLPSCRRLQTSSLNEVAAWFQGEADSISEAVSQCTDARLVMASVVRCRHLIETTTKRKVKKRQIEVASDLATWVAGMTVHTGGSAFSGAARRDLKDDLHQHGLLSQLTQFDPETLEPAVSAALGESQSGGKLAWQVCLPESMLSCEDARCALLLPEWDVRRGRVHVDFSREDLLLELYGGKPCLISGPWQVSLEVDGVQQEARGDWSQTCEYTDDEVHYLELEQRWSGDCVVQRQVLVLRDDRCVLLADSVICHQDDAKSSGTNAAATDPAAKDPGPAVHYSGRLPLAESMNFAPESDTREGFLSDHKRRAMVVPLAASEWRVGPTAASIEQSDDGHLVHRVSGSGRLYAPLWLDLQTRRFKRPRTWRQLTVADELRIVGTDEAVGYRVQMGSEQWMAYRALGEPRCRTVLGQHILVDFLCTRFDMGDGSHEELITVDVEDSDD